MTIAKAAGLALLLAGPGRAAGRGEPEDQSGGKAVIRQDISIRARGAGPQLQLPPPGAEKAVVDEVIDSLGIMKGEHSARAAGLQLSGAAKRLSRPFPEPPFLVFSPRSVSAPYDRWTFEVISEAEVLWRQEGVGRVEDRLEWDGSGPSGDNVVRVEKTYYYRFTGRRGAEAFTLTSEPVTLKSLALREYLGGMRLEIANRYLFKEGDSALAASAGEFLGALGDRLRRMAGDDPYKLELYETDPAQPLAKRRAETLRRWLADYLVVNAGRIEIDVLTAGARGNATASLLPAEKGDTIRDE